jgi:hypothetical protein
MNLGRGLLRAWIAISILWILLAGAMAFMIFAREAGGNYQAIIVIRNELNAKHPAEMDLPFYDTVVSPSTEKSRVDFTSVEWKYVREWENGNFYRLVEFPDGSRLFIARAYTDTDQQYITRQFWDQRWTRWTPPAAKIALVALVPCAVLFAFGYALLWVGRGFTPS